MEHTYPSFQTLEILTPLGSMLATATSKGICGLEFINAKNIVNNYNTNLDKTTSKYELNEHLVKLKEELISYFEGTLRDFAVPLDLMGTDFQKRVWIELLNIPFGETCYYEQQTLKLGDIKAIRAVASANGKNKIAIVIPCHRVIGKNGKLTGYAGGMERKRWLLDFEARVTGKLLF